MASLTVYYNGARICSAGLHNPGRLAARVVLFRREFGEPLFELKGSDFTKDIIFRWPSRILKVGDEIIIAIDKSENLDTPISLKSIKEKIECQKDSDKIELDPKINKSNITKLKTPWE